MPKNKRKARSMIFFLDADKSEKLRCLINRWRKLKGIKLKEIAQATGVSYDMIRHLLRPKSKLVLRHSFCKAVHKLVQQHRKPS